MKMKSWWGGWCEGVSWVKMKFWWGGGWSCEGVWVKMKVAGGGEDDDGMGEDEDEVIPAIFQKRWVSCMLDN